jgi:S-adenosyl-L-methionine hydrolase (adenosine-forming)
VNDLKESSRGIKQGARSGRLPVSSSGQITLLTDFGTSDYYVGAVRGVILSINPTAHIIDISHQISPHEIEEGAFTLLACYRSFQNGTIHLAVVDPGVGSSRRPILAKAGNYYFVGPDNGIFSYIFDQEPNRRIIHITAEEYFRHPVSTTFHGRDVFAPVAAELSRGVSLESFGPEIRDEVRLKALTPEVTKKGKLKGRIIHVDRFGNCVTNLDRQSFNGLEEQRVVLLVNGRKTQSVQSSYSEGHGHKLFALWGSAGFLEISARNRSAAKMLKAKRGDTVAVEFNA